MKAPWKAVKVLQMAEKRVQMVEKTVVVWVLRLDRDMEARSARLFFGLVWHLVGELVVSWAASLAVSWAVL